MLTSALTAAGTVYVLQHYDVMRGEGKQTDTVPVPQFQGLSEADARKNAEVARVAILVAGRESSDKEPEGTVLRQSIPPGQQVPPNHPVSVVLAREQVSVPELKGLTVADATLKLKEKGYELAAGESVPSVDVEAGKIIEQDPAAGSELARGQRVTVKTSSGAAEVEAPNLVGMTHEQAKAKAESLGLEAKFTWVSLAETPSYRVISQKPAPATKLKPKDALNLVVNR
ncbi:MAG TPA: PASTA domain-containing protein [Polyangiaceae bacterium]|nr:PASTA domain-containing protein [Polyangiaceae bacterium]